MNDNKVQMTDELFETFIRYMKLIRAFNRGSLMTGIRDKIQDCEMELITAGYSQDDLDRIIKAVR